MIRTIVCAICADTQTFGQYGELSDAADLPALAESKEWVAKSNGDYTCPECVKYDDELRFLGEKRLYDATDICITSNGIEVA